MDQNLRVLVAEGPDLNAMLIIEELQKSHFQVTWERVSSEVSLVEAIKSQPWDLILSAYSIPGLTALEALKILRELKLEIPFIVISKEIGEGKAIELIKHGCSDYVNIENLSSLGLTVQRTIKEYGDKLANQREKQKLVEIYDNLFTTLASIGDGIITTDIHGKIDFMNQKAEELTGWSTAKANGLDLYEVFQLTAGEKSNSLEKVKEAIAAGTPMGLISNTKMVSKDGNVMYVSASCAPIKNGGGELNGVVIVFRDITRIKLAEMKLANEERNLHTMFNAAPIGMMIIDNNVEIKRINRSLEKLVGRTEKEIVNKRFCHGLGCINSFKEGKNCGKGSSCKICELRKTLQKVVDSDVAVYGKEIEHTFLKNHQEETLWLRVNSVPININSKKQVLVVVDDITESKEVEEQIAKSRDFYLTLFEGFPSLIWRAGLDGKCNYFNKKWLEFTGRTIQQELDDGWLQGVHPDDREIRQKTYLHAFKYHKPFNLEYRLRRKDGEYRWIIDMGRPYYDLERKFAGYIGTSFDITERIKAVEGVRRYKVLSEKARDIILFIDLEGNILEVNNSAVEAYGYTHDELVSMTIYDIRKDAIKPRGIKRAIDTGLFYEAVHMRKDGTSFPVEISANGSKINNQDVLICIVRDISERKKAEEALKESRENYQSLFNNMTNGFAYHQVILDAAGKPIDYVFLEINDEFSQLMGLKREELVGKRVSEILPNVNELPFDRIGIFGRVALTGESIRVEDYYSEIAERWYTCSVFSTKKGYFAMLLSDITIRRKIEEKTRRAKEAAEAANKAKSEFLANMSHEIRTPLNGIIGMTNLTLMTELTAEQKENVQIAKNCADSLLKIINDILDFSKIEAGKMVIEEVQFNFKDLCEKTVSVHSISAQEKGLQTTYSFDEEIPEVLTGDPTRLEQILNNLISNAVKFTEMGGISLHVSTYNKAQDTITLKFAVTDTGVGISSKNQRKLFRSFSQVDGSITRKYGGTGLGLAISKQLVEMMDGRIWVESEEGKGSTFNFIIKFNLPQNHSHSQRGGSLDTSSLVTDFNQIKVLVVEDDKVNQMVLTRILEKHGFSYKLANNGIEALDEMETEDFDLVLMDIHMPVLDGIEATKRIRAKENGTAKHVPIIALTAYALQGDREKFLAVGMDEYIAKPFSPEELFMAIKRIIEQSKVFNPHTISKNEKEDTAIDLAKYINNLKQALAEKNYILAETLAHQLKIYFSRTNPALKNLVFKMELALRKKDYLKVNDYYVQLVSVVHGER